MKKTILLSGAAGIIFLILGPLITFALIGIVPNFQNAGLAVLFYAFLIEVFLLVICALLLGIYTYRRTHSSRNVLFGVGIFLAIPIIYFIGIMTASNFIASNAENQSNEEFSKPGNVVYKTSLDIQDINDSVEIDESDFVKAITFSIVIFSDENIYLKNPYHFLINYCRDQTSGICAGCKRLVEDNYEDKLYLRKGMNNLSVRYSNFISNPNEKLYTAAFVPRFIMDFQSYYPVEGVIAQNDYDGYSYGFVQVIRNKTSKGKEVKSDIVSVNSPSCRVQDENVPINILFEYTFSQTPKLQFN